MQDAAVVTWIGDKFRALDVALNERSRRRWAAVEALSLGRGGISAVALATGLSRTTIRAGIRELRQADQEELSPERVRRAGGGRKCITEKDPQVMAVLESLVEPSTRGDPQSPLRWTCRSVRQLSGELRKRKHPVGPTTVAKLLHEAGYSLQANRKTREGSDHPDRNAQFEYIHAQVRAFQSRSQPVISVDTKKKELVGRFRNGGREWRPKGKPLEVEVHDFPDPEVGKAIPYGVYDLTNNEAWVSVGIDHDTAEFAAEAVYRWWARMGKKRFAQATTLYITADGGGSNGSRLRLWKVALQNLADRTGLTLTVSHFPRGTSKWNKIEHRLFCHITRNWRGRPLESYQIIVSLISHTTTQDGLRVRAALDRRRYATKKKVSDQELGEVHIAPHDFHGDWNYTVSPRR
jgi:transposase